MGDAGGQQRVVVVAPYPTMPGPEAAATFSYVRSLVRAGHDVTVVSPVPSAAHHHADPAGALSALRVRRIAAGADLLHLRLDAAAQAVDQESLRHLLTRLGLHAMLRRRGRSEIRLDRVPPVVGRQWARLVLGPADRILVSSAEERSALAAAGVVASKVEVEPEPEMAEAGAHRSTRTTDIRIPDRASAADLREVVRSRAAEERAGRRRAVAGRYELGASLPLRHLVRMERPPVRSNKPGGAFVKRAIAKALQWQFDNVIGSVNRLHQATIDAIEILEGRQARSAGEDERTNS